MEFERNEKYQSCLIHTKRYTEKERERATVCGINESVVQTALLRLHPNPKYLTITVTLIQGEENESKRERDEEGLICSYTSSQWTFHSSP